MEFDITRAQQPSLFRRLGAMLYDSLLLLGILMLATALVTIPYEMITHTPIYDTSLPLTLLRLYLLAVVAAFYVYFWARGGQTLGMRAWRFRVIQDDGNNLTFGSALTRFDWALLSLLPAGLGLWWSLFDRDGLAWHDRKSHSRLVMLSQAAK